MLTALYADKNGKIYDAPGYQAVGRSGEAIALLSESDMIPLPPSAELMFLPGRSAVAGQKGAIEPIARELFAVAAILPAGYTRTLLPAFAKLPDAPHLPLFGYTAVAFKNGKLLVAAVKSDDNAKWDPRRYNGNDLAHRVAEVKHDLPNNRIVDQLANCSQTWHCLTAQNLFYRRWEAGIPASPVCNANCYGCISLQPAECCPSPQSRIEFAPTATEIAAVGVYHLSTAPEGIISFGQGCEGEPSLAYENVSQAIRIIRRQTDRGLININTNAGFSVGIRSIVDAGLDTMRVSMISAIPEVYQAYYRANYQLDAVAASIDYAKSHGIYVSINLLLFPGLNDTPDEIRAWQQFIIEHQIDMIQIRNLNVDPDDFWQFMDRPAATAVGVKTFIEALRQASPKLVVGSFSRYVR
ncbi:MAG: Pyruvate-formate lyase-activating enzyme [Anaerosporomusa subterranea]|jgi:pyruvate-formate lyase-activating enzyme|nr:Pyruvate-formate lyase-activating enzyme [Anaerosporomusa subterranea]